MKNIFKAPDSQFDPLSPPPLMIEPGLAHKLGKIAESDPQIADLIMPSVRRVVEDTELKQVEKRTQVPLATDEPRLSY